MEEPVPEMLLHMYRTAVDTYPHPVDSMVYGLFTHETVMAAIKECKDLIRNFHQNPTQSGCEHMRARFIEVCQLLSSVEIAGRDHLNSLVLKQAATINKLEADLSDALSVSRSNRKHLVKKYMRLHEEYRGEYDLSDKSDKAYKSDDLRAIFEKKYERKYNSIFMKLKMAGLKRPYPRHIKCPWLLPTTHKTRRESDPGFCRPLPISERDFKF